MQGEMDKWRSMAKESESRKDEKKKRTAAEWAFDWSGGLKTSGESVHDAFCDVASNRAASTLYLSLRFSISTAVRLKQTELTDRWKAWLYIYLFALFF